VRQKKAGSAGPKVYALLPTV